MIITRKYVWLKYDRNGRINARGGHPICYITYFSVKFPILQNEVGIFT